MSIFTYLVNIFFPHTRGELITRFIEIILLFLIYMLSKWLYKRYKENIAQRRILFKGALLFFLIIFFLFNLTLYMYIKIPFFPVFSLAIFLGIIAAAISVSVSLIKDLINRSKGKETQGMF